MLSKKKIISSLLAVVMSASMTIAFADTNTNYNRTNAANYAAQYVENRNTAYYEVPGNDCTNFASQCVKAGGMSMTGNGGNYSNYNNWYGGSGGGSATWENAHQFRYHWGNVNGTGRKRAYSMTKVAASEVKPYNNTASDNKWTNSIYNVVKPGDIIQYYNPNTNETYHSQVVHRISIENGELKVSMAQHTGNGWRNLRDYIRSNCSDSTIICILKIKND